jgi:conjugative transfer signal peptidase TraF
MKRRLFLRRLLLLALLLAAYLALARGLSSLGLAVNRSPSLPVGLYRLLARPARRHDLVLVCLPPGLAMPARRRGYLGSGTCPAGAAPLGKILLARAGDRVLVDASGLSVNGVRVPGSRIAPRDAMGLSLRPLAPGLYRVAPGSVWLFSPYHPLSWDSRYYGAVPEAGVVGVLEPLLVLGAGNAPAGFRLHPFHSGTW